ncbi:protein RADIALIS-like 4 [Elaeis guineensis]|uniref:Protein RADIALIS-like 4 n=1 Tax=Elaeis guineensis var. tenera TaxID=51953 RepID=A0A6I9QTG4_ELAGV|nr:protein RADIALIS-like 4 [Elaeis guineensis]
MEDPDESGNVPSGWSWEDNKLFELALAVVDEGNPDRWEAVASIIGGKRSAEEVKSHYEVLLEDLDIIESGRLDHAVSAVLNDTQDVCWTDEDQERLAQLNIR